MNVELIPFWLSGGVVSWQQVQPILIEHRLVTDGQTDGSTYIGHIGLLRWYIVAR